MKLFLFFLIVLNGSVFSEDGVKKKYHEMEDVTKNMTKITLEMKKTDVEDLLGPAFWENGEIIGENKKEIYVWQILPKKEDIVDEKKQPPQKFLSIKYKNDCVVEIKTTLVFGVIGVKK